MERASEIGRLILLPGCAHWPLRGTSIIVGRCPVLSQIVIRSAAVSRQHCRIVVDRTVVVIEDLGSLNGTWVNGVRVERTQLQPNSVLNLGEQLMIFELALRYETLSINCLLFSD